MASLGNSVEGTKIFLTGAIMDHAPFQLYLHSAENKDRDLIDLFENGVKYTYEGKTWHVRFGIQHEEDGSIGSIFARCHSDKQIRGYWFNGVDDTKYSDTRFKYNLEPRPLKGRSSSEGIEKGLPPAFRLCYIIKDGIRTDEAEVPRVYADAETRQRCAKFFRECPELVPPYFDRQPHDSTEPPNPTQSPYPVTGRSYWKWAVASSLFVIAALYLVVQYSFQEDALPPVDKCQ